MLRSDLPPSSSKQCFRREWTPQHRGLVRGRTSARCRAISRYESGDADEHMKDWQHGIPHLTPIHSPHAGAVEAQQTSGREQISFSVTAMRRTWTQILQGSPGSQSKPQMTKAFKWKDAQNYVPGKAPNGRNPCALETLRWLKPREEWYKVPLSHLGEGSSEQLHVDEAGPH